MAHPLSSAEMSIFFAKNYQFLLYQDTNCILINNFLFFELFLTWCDSNFDYVSKIGYLGLFKIFENFCYFEIKVLTS